MLGVPTADQRKIRENTLYALIAVNVGVFLFLTAQSQFDVSRVLNNPWAFKLGLFLTPGQGPDWIPSQFYKLISHQFVHAGLLHLGLNMFVLYSFGRQIVVLMKPWLFVLFYLLCGVGAALFFWVLNMDRAAFLVGASGAIFGILAGYLVLLFRFNRQAAMSFATQLILMNLIFTIGYNGFSSGGQVAWEAHVGGMLTGFILAPFFLPILKRNKELF